MSLSATCQQHVSNMSATCQQQKQTWVLATSICCFDVYRQKSKLFTACFASCFSFRFHRTFDWKVIILRSTIYAWFNRAVVWRVTMLMTRWAISFFAFFLRVTPLSTIATFLLACWLAPVGGHFFSVCSCTFCQYRGRVVVWWVWNRWMMNDEIILKKFSWRPNFWLSWRFVQSSTGNSFWIEF